MKLYITIVAALFISLSLQAQVQINDKQIKGVADPSDVTDAVNVRSVQSGNILYATANGNNTIFLTLVPAITNYKAGMVVNFKCPESNTNAVTININGLGAKPLFKNVTDVLEFENIKKGQMVSIIYDGNNFQLLSTPNTPNLGKTYITLTGNISNEEAAAKMAKDFGINTQFVSISNCSQLTNIDLSMCTDLESLAIMGNNNLENINAENLKTIGGSININGTKLTTLNLNALQTVGGSLNINNSNISTISLPALQMVNFLGIQGMKTTAILLSQLKALTAMQISYTSISNLNLSQVKTISQYARITYNQSLTNINFSGLTSIGTIEITDDTLLLDVNLNQLKTISNYSVFSKTSIGTLFFPALDTLSAYLIINKNKLLTGAVFNSLLLVSDFLSITENPLLNLIHHPNLKSFKQLNFRQNMLSTSTVNNLLAFYTALSPQINNSTINLEGQLPPAPPTNTGVLNKATLISRGNTVTTD